jgi:hypothetical protein
MRVAGRCDGENGPSHELSDGVHKTRRIFGWLRFAISTPR